MLCLRSNPNPFTTILSCSLVTMENRGGGGGTDGVFLFPTVQFTHRHHHHPIIKSCLIPYRIGEASTTVHLVRCVILRKDDGYAFGTSTIIEIFIIQNYEEEECRMTANSISYTHHHMVDANGSFIHGMEE
jgi:hypothetical protein